MRSLDRRRLNRATLARQLLLRRSDLTPLEAIEHLVGLQAQTTHTWYVGLWSRLASFRAADASALLESRQAVRIALMRSTIHLVSAADALALRPLVQIVSERGLRSNFGRNLTGVDHDEIASAGRAILDETPMTFSELGRALAHRWPGRDEASLAQVVRARLGLVQIPPRGLWGRSGLARHAPLESWVGAPLAPGTLDDMVLRYLAAFGPASVRDVQTWSGLTRLGEVVDRLRPRLVTLRDPGGTELFDLPDAPRPDGDVRASVRFLYDFDNLLLSHADRSRVIADTIPTFDEYGAVPRIVLVDGFTAGTWTVAQSKGFATLTIEPFAKLSKKDTSALETEAAHLLTFLAPGAVHQVHITG